MIPTINGAPTWLDGIDRDAPDWTGALCRESDPELFFPEKGSAYASGDEAKAICQRCPLLDTCLAYALPRPYILGIWGGTSERERRRMRTALQPVKNDPAPINHGTERGYSAHKRRGERPCADCRDANLEARRERARKRKARTS